MGAPKAASARGNNNKSSNGQQDAGQQMFAQLRHDLNNDNFRNGVAAAVPKEFRYVGYVDRLCESIFLACRDNHKLLTDCNRASLLRAAERIAKKGLIVGDNVAWLVPYNGQVQDQLGYKGAMIQVRRSGIPMQISSQAVFLRDPCEINLGTDAHITHSPFLDGDRGHLRGCYAFSKYLDTGTVEAEWLEAEKIEAIRQRAPSSNSPAWKNYFDEMGRKIVLKRLCKRLPTERPIDLEDMDDRMSQAIEGVAVHVDPPAIAAPNEQPINVVTPATDKPDPEADTIPAHIIEAGDGGGGEDLFPKGG